MKNPIVILLLSILTSQLAVAQVSCELGEVRTLPNGFAINKIRIINESSTPITQWRAKLVFDESVLVSRFWGADLEDNGEYYEVSSTSYNGDLDIGASTAFGVKGAGRFEAVECIAVSITETPETFPGSDIVSR